MRAWPQLAQAGVGKSGSEVWKLQLGLGRKSNLKPFVAVLPLWPLQVFVAQYACFGISVVVCKLEGSRANMAHGISRELRS